MSRHLDGFHECHTIGCRTMVAGQDFCPRCQEEMDGEPYSLADVLNEAPKVNYTILVCVGALIFALITWLVCR